MELNCDLWKKINIFSTLILVTYVTVNALTFDFHHVYKAIIKADSIRLFDEMLTTGNYTSLVIAWVTCFGVGIGRTNVARTRGVLRRKRW